MSENPNSLSNVACVEFVMYIPERSTDGHGITLAFSVNKRCWQIVLVIGIHVIKVPGKEPNKILFAELA